MVSRLPTPNYSQYGFKSPGASRQPATGPKIATKGKAQYGTQPWRQFVAENELGVPYGEGPETVLYQQMKGGGGPGQGLIPGLMQEMPAGMSPRRMKQWFNDMAPMLAGSLFQSPSYQYLQDPQNWDQSMQAYGAGAGMLGQSAQQGQTAGQNQLARMGLGRSGAQAALANQTAQTLGGQQANMFTNLYQQSIQNRMRGAQNAFDLDRAIMSMVTGMGPGREKGGSGGSALLGAGVGAAGNAVGSLLGSLFSGGGGGGGGISPQAGPGLPGSNFG